MAFTTTTFYPGKLEDFGMVFDDDEMPTDLKHSIQERMDAGEKVDIKAAKEQYKKENRTTTDGTWTFKPMKGGLIYGITGV